MGCICSSQTVKKTEPEQPQTLIMKNASVKPQPSNNMNVEEMIKTKAISISQGTFVTEKKYITFIKEYDILEFIGKGTFISI
jgi:hypothetical protein